MSTTTPQITVDGTDINFDELSDQSKYFYTQIVNVKAQINEQQLKLAQLEAANQVFEASFIESVKEVEEQEAE